MAWTAAAYGRGVDPQFDAEELRTDDGSGDRGRATGSRRSQGPAFVVTSARPGHTEEMSGRLAPALAAIAVAELAIGVCEPSTSRPAAVMVSQPARFSSSTSPCSP